VDTRALVIWPSLHDFIHSFPSFFHETYINRLYQIVAIFMEKWCALKKVEAGIDGQHAMSRVVAS
jgi:hypothetical protein